MGDLMKKLRSFLAVVIALSLVAGFPLSMTEYGSIQMKNTVLAAAKDKKITVKAASDFTLRLPANWKNNYVIKRSKNKKHGSYVAFYSKKCYRETGEGWIFSIIRYKDDTYTDLPNYELVGKWSGINYVAVFPIDVQTRGATKAAKKQYKKLRAGAEKAAASIQPVQKRKKGKDVYRALDFSLKLPASWKNKYIVATKGTKQKNSFVTFYAKKCHRETKAGFLFSIVRFQDESYQELPAYELVGKWNGVSYVAEFPTDVQFEGASKEAVKQYQQLNKSVEKTARSISR